ncbi:MAG: hypothetical protein AAB468_01210 [Patescibacteria group bacterium]
MKKQFKLGDMIAKITKILHLPHCSKCEKRRQILNEIGNGKPWSIGDIVKKLAHCCDEK